MKRIVLEWGMLVSVGMALAFSALWGLSRYVERSSFHLRVPTSSSVGDDLHVIVGEGDLFLSDQFDVDATGNARPLVIDRKSLAQSDILRGDRTGRSTMPGLDLQYYRNGLDGYLVWSLKVSLLIPALLSSLLAVVLRRLLKRREDEGVSASPPAGSPGAQGDPLTVAGA